MGNDQAIMWEMKPRTGLHRIRKDGKTRTIKPGDRIKATARELSGAIDKFQPLEAIPAERQPEPEKMPMIQSLGEGKFNVLHPGTMNPINDVPLSLGDARQMARIPVREDPGDGAKKVVTAASPAFVPPNPVASEGPPVVTTAREGEKPKDKLSGGSQGTRK